MSDDQHYTPTKEFEKQRKSRNRAIALSLAAFVLLVFVITIVRLGPDALTRGF